MAQDTDKPAEKRVPGPELRLLDRRAFIGFPALDVAPGVRVTDFALQIPDVTFPLNISGGASRYQKKKLDFGLLELTVDAEVIARAVAGLQGQLTELEDLKLHFRPGYLEGQGRLRSDGRAATTFKVAFDGDGEKLAVFIYDVRLYAFAPTPASRLPALISDSLVRVGALPAVERRGANGFTTRILPPLVELAAVARGFKMPSLDQARLAEARVSSKGVTLRFAAGGLPPPGTPDEELLLTLEGARAFADAEEHLAQGRLAEARIAYLKLGDATEAHPFAAERLLTLLVADPQAHELALDVAQSLARRRDKSATALWAEAVVRERRGEFARAAERFLALSTLARRNQEEAGAFFAAEAGSRAGRDHAPQMAVKALHELLGLKPDHLPSLKALARASDQAKDRAGAIRAYRRLAALARDPADAAEAHVQLARLSAHTEDDVAGARLHCEAALRLFPDHPEALFLLGELCFQGGEHLRAIKALDRLREVGMARHEVDRVGRANLLAGKVWEEGLQQPENALLRYREAASLLPAEAEPLVRAAGVAEKLGRVQEALAGYQQAIELAGPAPSREDVRTSARTAHHAIAKLFQSALQEPAKAKEHLEAALALDPTDLSALEELIPHFRITGRVAELADACEKAALVVAEGPRKAALWAEAGELYRARLSQTERAERLFGLALEVDAHQRQALEGLLAIAEAKRDGPLLCRCLKALAETATDARERVRHDRRLAVAARDLALDLELAAEAFRRVLEVEPLDLPVLGELCALERRRADMPGLAWALERRASAAEHHGDQRLAAAALRELGAVLEARLGRPGDALVAYEKACRLAPDPTALLELANLSLRCERPQNARRALEDALALLPKHAAPEKLAEIRARLGRACEMTGDLDRAREAYAQAFPLRKLDDELAGRLAALYEDAGQVQELTELWAARAQALLGASRPQEAAPLLFRAAKALLQAGDVAQARARLSAALDASPTGDQAAQAIELLAELELQRNEVQEAARLFARRASLEKEPRSAARAYFKAAQLVRGTSREVGFLVQAMELDGSFVPARLRHAELVQVDEPAAALLDLEVALASDKEDVDAAAAHIDRTALVRRAGLAALRANQPEGARRHLSHYAAVRPDDLEVQLELVKLHRGAGATEALVDLLGELWPRAEGQQRLSFRKEFAEGTLRLGRTDDAREVLRAMLVDGQDEAWAAGQLLPLLPPEPGFDTERLELIGRLATFAQGDARAELLVRRAALRRQRGELDLARVDLADASQASSAPIPILRQLVETVRATHDEGQELQAWRLLLERAAGDEVLARDASTRLLGLGRSRAQAKDFPRAAEAFQTVVRLPLGGEELQEAWLGLAQAARELGDDRRAEAALLEAAKKGPVARRVEALLERARLLEARDARTEAIESLEAVRSLAPRHEAATQSLKRNLAALEDFEGLAEVLAAEAQGTPKSLAAPKYAELAALYLDRLGQLGPAEKALEQVVLLDETDAFARRRLAEVKAKKSEWVAASELLEEAAALSAANEAQGLFTQAAAYATTSHDAARALRLLRRAHGAKALEGAPRRELADLLFLHGAVAEALPLQVLVAKEADFAEDPDSAVAAHLRLADLAEATKDFGTAERALRRVVQERPLDGTAVERLAATLQEKSPKEALGILSSHALALAPSVRAERRLLELARRARTEQNDLELAARLYTRAAEVSESPLAIRRELLGVLAEAGRTSEALVELRAVAQLELEAGDFEGALATHGEEAKLAESAGRLDEAVAALRRVAFIAADDSQPERAADALVKVAALHEGGKQELDAAEQALQEAWGHHASPAIARQGIALAVRRADRDAEIDWLERTLDSYGDTTEKARAFVGLARLHLGLPATGELPPLTQAPMLAPEQAEAALRHALTLAPGLAEAETLLLALLERQDRVGEVAAYFEEAASRSPSLAERAQLYLKAAALYRDRARQPANAAAALLAARAANPEDVGLTAQVADQLHALGRGQDAADFDALLLESDPFHPAFSRHQNWLETSEDFLGLAQLLSRRAEKEQGDSAATTWLLAAEAFRRAGATERANICEDQAFEASAADLDAFQRQLGRAGDDARRRADVLAARARAVPQEAAQRLRERAQGLSRAGEAIRAAQAWDDLLGVVPDDLEALRVRGDLAAQGGDARAAQPYDRRLVALAGASLPDEVLLNVWLRLGHAGLEAEAFVDAADALETALRLAPQGPKSGEVLSLLSEAYTRANDAQGLYRVTLQLAGRAQGDEAWALYRRAAALPTQPEQALEALEKLARQFPQDRDVYTRLSQALFTLGRAGDLIALHEAHADAVGGATAATALLEAAGLAEGELRDGAKATALRQKAALADPANVTALQLVADDVRKSGDAAALEAALAALAQRLEPDAAAEAWLEVAALREGRGDSLGARQAYETVRAGGPGATGYGAAIEGLVRVTQGADLGAALLARAELESGSARATSLLEAAKTLEGAGQLGPATDAVKASLAARPTHEGYLAAARLAAAQDERLAEAQWLSEAAALVEGDAKSALWLKAIDAYDAAEAVDSAGALLERFATEFPQALAPLDLSRRFEQLGLANRAFEVGFAPSLAANDQRRALRLAEGAGDADRVLEVLWALAQADGESPEAQRLAAFLEERGDATELGKLARLLETNGGQRTAKRLWRALVLTHGSAEAVARLEALGELELVVTQALDAPRPKVVEVLVPRAAVLPVPLRRALLEAATQATPARAAELLRTRVDLELAEGKLETAAELLGELARREDDVRGRAVIHFERGELLLEKLNRPVEARAAYERALVDDPRSVPALQRLLELDSGDAPPRFAALVEQLVAMVGGDAAASHRPKLADAYEQMGRLREAARVLSELPETPERLERRARLAQALGNTGESLSLRERVANTPEEREQVLRGYLDAELVPFAVRLGEMMRGAGELSGGLQRRLAERLSPTRQGAAFAAALWPDLLAATPNDVDGWTLFAEALELVGRHPAAELADGVGAALTSSQTNAPMVRPEPVAAPDAYRFPAVPAGLQPITESSMPRLYLTLQDALEALGAKGMSAALDPTGGVELYLGQTALLVVGAGALSAYGPAELVWATALALALGEDGHQLTHGATVARLVEAAEAAFDAYPSSLAAGRVLALLDDRVRGSDPSVLVMGELLRDNEAFAAVVRRVVARLRGV